MILTHDDYIARVSYEEGDELMHGVTVNTRSVLHFAGKTVEELKQAFADTIADYRDFCARKGVDAGEALFRHSVAAAVAGTARENRRRSHEGGRKSQSVHRRETGRSSL